MVQKSSAHFEVDMSRITRRGGPRLAILAAAERIVMRTDDRLPPSLATAQPERGWTRPVQTGGGKAHDEMLAVPAREHGRRQVLRGVRRASGASMCEAVTCYEQALAVLRHLPESAGTQRKAIPYGLYHGHLAVGAARTLKGEVELAIPALERALRIATESRSSEELRPGRRLVTGAPGPSPTSSECALSWPSAASALGGSTAAPAITSEPRMSSPAPPGCSARWTCALGWSGRRQR